MQIYNYAISEVSKADFWKTHVLGYEKGEFIIEKKTNLWWFGKVWRWLKGTYRLKPLHDLIQKEIESIIIYPDQAKRRKMEFWQHALPSFQKDVIDVHNKRRWFNLCQAPSLQAIAHRVFHIWNSWQGENNTFLPDNAVKPNPEGYSWEGKIPSAEYRTAICHGTIDAIKNGYINSKGEYIQLDNESAEKGCSLYANLGPITVEKLEKPTEFVTVNQDTFQSALELLKKVARVVVLNMAHKAHPGGGWLHGASAQEEALCRSSNLIKGLTPLKKNHPHAAYIQQEGGAYSKNISVFRTHINDKFKFMDKPVKLDVISVAAFDLRNNSHDRAILGLPESGKIDLETLRKNEKFMRGTEAKIVQMLRKLAVEGHRNIVLGSLGCGAFDNPPELIAGIFEKVFKTEEMKNVFERVVFAVLKIVDRDLKNIAEFEAACERLNKTTT